MHDSMFNIVTAALTTPSHQNLCADPKGWSGALTLALIRMLVTVLFLFDRVHTAGVPLDIPHPSLPAMVSAMLLQQTLLNQSGDAPGFGEPVAASGVLIHEN